MAKSPDTAELVKTYYGQTLQGTKDLQTNACCTDIEPPAEHKAVLSLIHDEVMSKFYGCGSPIPADLAGKTVLDLGCGTGRDAYLCAKLVGPSGRVIGVDMTDEQLEVALRHVDFHTAAYGFDAPNIRFEKGVIEDLQSAGIADNSVDVVISNCVINLSSDKTKVFSEILRVLKPGGELYFSDVFANRRIPEALQKDAELYGECLSGALYTEDFRRMLRDLGVLDFRTMEKRPITIENPQLQKKIGHIDFFSITVRAFKLETLEDLCEDYGQIARYKGTIQHHEAAFVLDDHHTFEAGRMLPVCGNTASMLAETRFAPHFEILGDRQSHYGLFDCAEPAGGDAAAAAGCC